MKIKMNEGLQFLKLYEEIKNQKMSFQLSYNFAKLYKQLNEEQQFYLDKIKEILNNCGKKKENGNLDIDEKGNIAIEPSKIQECQNQIQELENLEIDCIFSGFLESDLQNLELTPNQMTILFPFIKINKEE